MQAWEGFVETLNMEMGSETVEKWLKSLKILRFDACNLYLEAKDSFQAMWFEEHIRKKVLSRLYNNNHRRIKVHLSVANATEKAKAKPQKTPKNTNASAQPFNLTFDSLDSHCTFSTFVVSENNILTSKVFSQIVGQSVEGESSQEPIELSSLTPLYVSGPSGSGKTHLLMAAATALRAKGLHVIYAKAQSFTDHVVSAIRAGEMSTFRQAYRNSDVLIIDDIHVLSRKGATQEEFFHTFNTLHVAGKQIILSANCTPAELQFIEPRLVSRFEWGIALTLEIPSKDKMEQILKERATALSSPLHSKVADFLLESFPNPKSLSQSLEALVLRSHLNQHLSKLASNQLTVAMAKDILSDLLLEQQQSAITPTRVVQHAAAYFGIRPEDILGKAQTRDCVLPRQISMHFCRYELKLPYLRIGELFARDHSTVMTSVKRIQKGMEDDDDEIVVPYRNLIKKIKA
jgi:chromosomal replication initiator protein